jgi:phosphatidylglycerophosphatase A
MSATTKPSVPAGADRTASVAASASAPPRRPRFALFIATACGLGYLPKAPGTWGSLLGAMLVVLPWWTLVAIGIVSQNKHLVSAGSRDSPYDPLFGCQIWIALTIAFIGIWCADRASEYWSEKDPSRVVIDEVSGQHFTLFLGCSLPIWWKPQPPWTNADLGFVTVQAALNWKYLLLGFILFRVFDIWKPFPARQAESLPGGWGIMVDDWVAGIYAGIGLWVARAAGL